MKTLSHPIWRLGGVLTLAAGATWGLNAADATSSIAVATLAMIAIFAGIVAGRLAERSQ